AVLAGLSGVIAYSSLNISDAEARGLGGGGGDAPAVSDPSPQVNGSEGVYDSSGSPSPSSQGTGTNASNDLPAPGTPNLSRDNEGCRTGTCDPKTTDTSSSSHTPAVIVQRGECIVS